MGRGLQIRTLQRVWYFGTESQLLCLFLPPSSLSLPAAIRKHTYTHARAHTQTDTEINKERLNVLNAFWLFSFGLSV